MVLTTVPTTALTVKAETLDPDNEISGEMLDAQSGSDEILDEITLDDSEPSEPSEPSDDEKKSEELKEELKNAISQAEGAIAEQNKDAALEAAGKIGAILDNDEKLAVLTAADGGEDLIAEAIRVGDAVVEAFKESEEPTEPTVPQEPATPENSINLEDSTNNPNSPVMTLEGDFEVEALAAVEALEGAPVTIEQYESGNDDAVGTGLEGPVAMIEATGMDGGSASGEDIVLQVFANEGWYGGDSTGKIAVTASADRDGTPSPLTVIGDMTASDDYGTFTVKPDVRPSGSGENKKPGGFSGPVTIKVTGKQVTSALKLDAALGGGVDAALLKDGNVDTKLTGDGSAATTFKYSATSDDIVVAVKGVGSKYKKIIAYTGTKADADAKKAGLTVAAEGTHGTAPNVYDLFTFKPADVPGVNKTADTEIWISLSDSEAARALAIAPEKANSANDEYQVTLVDKTKLTTADKAADIITLNSGSTAFVMSDDSTLSLNEDNYAQTADTPAKDRVVAFKVAPKEDSGYKVTRVFAKLTTAAEASDPDPDVFKNAGREITAEAVEGADDGSIEAYYRFDLSDIEASEFTADMKLTVMAEVEADLETNGNGVHKISYTANGHVKVEGEVDDSGEDIDLPAEYSAKMDKITLKLTPDKGYDLAKGNNPNGGSTATDEKPVIKVTYDKKYEYTDNDSNKWYLTVPGETDLEVDMGTATSGTYSTDIEFDNSYTDTGWVDHKNDEEHFAAIADNTTSIPYTWEDVKVSIETVVNEGGKTGTVTIDSLELPYTVKPGSGVEKIYGDQYEITEDATSLFIDVASDTKPVVKFVGTGNTPGTAALAVEDRAITGEKGKYTVEIPVNLMYLNGSTEIEETVVIGKGEKTMTVKATLDGTAVPNANVAALVDMVKVDELPDAAFSYSAGGGGVPAATTATYSNLLEGKTASVTVKAPAGTELNKITTQVGAKGTVNEVQLGEDKSTVTFPVTMSDVATVTVDLKAIYSTTVTYSGKEADQDEENDTWTVPADSKNIVVTLHQGLAGTPSFKYAKLYKGSAAAATKIKSTTTDTVTIDSIDAEDQASGIRVEMTVNSSTKVSTNIKCESAASKLKIVDNGAEVSELTVMADSAMDFKVVAESGSMQYAKDNNNIGYEVVTDVNDPASVSPSTSNQYVKANYVFNAEEKNGDLHIEVLPQKESVNGKAVIRFFDKAKRTANRTKADATDADKIAAMAAVTVNVTGASILTEKPSVKFVNASKDTVNLEVSTSNKVQHPTGTEYKNAVLYKVTVDGANVVDADKVQYFKKHYYGTVNKAETLPVHITRPKDKDNNEVEDVLNYTLTVQLVQTTESQEGWQDGDEATFIANAKSEDTAKKLVLGGSAAAVQASTNAPIYETKLTMKPSSVTVNTGQSSTLVTQAQFGKTTGHVAITDVIFVNTKTGQEYSNSYDDYSVTYSGTNVYIAGGNDIHKDFGVKVTASAPGADGSSYAATAIVKVNTVKGINAGGIQFASGSPRKIYKQAGKAATLKLTAVLNGGDKKNAPKNKKLTYALGAYGSPYMLAAGESDGEGHTGSYPANMALYSALKIDPKNGKVTVDKGFMPDAAHPEKNRFSVIAKADYDNSVRARVDVEITSTPQSLGELVIVDASGTVIARDGGIIKAEDFFTTTGTKNRLYVKAVDEKKGGKNKYNAVEANANGDFVDGVSYTSGSKNALSVSSVDGELKLLKAQAKPIKLTLAPADGGKGQKKTMNITVNGYKEIGLAIDGKAKNFDGVRANKMGELKDSATYSGPINAKFVLTPYVKVRKEWLETGSTNVDLADYTGLSISVKGAKVLKADTAKNKVDYLTIVMTSSVATITISDKAKSAATKTYTIKQEPATKMASAPTIKAAKLTTDDIAVQQRYEAGDLSIAEPVKVKFQITDKKAVPANHARKYVMITPDYSKDKVIPMFGREWSRANEYFLDDDADGYGDEEVIKQVDDYGMFDLALHNLGTDKYSYVSGNYSLMVTVGDFSDGVFVPSAKDKAVKVTIPGKNVPKQTLTLKGKYTLDECGGMVPLDANGNINAGGYSWYLDTTGVVNAKTGERNYAMNKITNNGKGKTNNFTTYFKVVKDADNNYWLGMQEGLTQAQISEIMDTKSAAGKNDRTGYVTVKSYQGDKTMVKDMMITVSFKKSTMVAKTVCDSTYMNGANTVATVRVYDSARSTTPIELLGADIRPGNGDGGATIEDKTTGVTKNGTKFTDIKVKLPSAEANKSYTVNLAVLAKGSTYNTLEKDKRTKKQLALDLGRDVKVTIKVSGTDEKTKNKVLVTGKDFKFDTYANGKYSFKVKMDSAIEGAGITKVSLNTGKSYAGGDSVQPTMSRDRDGYVTVTMDRTKFLAVSNAKNSKFKAGAKADIPVDVQITGSGVNAGTETVTLKVTLPNPLTYKQVMDKINDGKSTLNQMMAGLSADLYKANGTDKKADLQSRIIKVFRTEIPEDAQIQPIRDADLALRDVAADPTKGTPASYEVKIVIKADAKDKGVEKSWSFAKEIGDMDGAAALATAIAALDGTKLHPDNDYTEEKFLAEVREALAAGEVAVPANLKLSVKPFVLGTDFTKATSLAGGSFQGTILIRDTRKPADASAVEAQLSAPITWSALGTLKSDGTAVENALKETDMKKEYVKVIYNALDQDQDVQEKLKEKILSEANKAITNKKGVAVSGFVAFTDIPAGYTGAPQDEVIYKLDTTNSKIFVQYKLELTSLTNPNMKAYVVDFVTTPIEQFYTGIDGVSFQSFTDAKTAVEGLLKANSSDSTKWDVKNPIYLATQALIQEELEERVNGAATGAGITKTVTITDFTAPTDSVEGKVVGKIELTNRLDSDNATNYKKWDLLIDLGTSNPTITGITVSATKKVGSGDAEDVALTDSNNKLNNTSVDKDSVTVYTFTGEITGTWLTGEEEIEWVEVENGSGDELSSNAHAGATVAVSSDKQSVTIMTDTTTLLDSASVNVYLKVSTVADKGVANDSDKKADKVITVTLQKAAG